MNVKQIKSTPFFLLIAFLVLFIGIWGTVRLKERPGIKAVFEESDNQLRIIQLTPGSKALSSGLKSGDLILEVEDNPVNSKTDFYFYTDQKKVGESVKLTLGRDEEKIELAVLLESKNSWIFLTINFLAGLFLWGMGVFVFLKSPQSQVSRIFLISSLSFSLAILISWEGLPYGPEILGFVLPSFHIISYTLIPALFFHFSMIFTREEEVTAQGKPLIYSVYLPGLVLILLMEIFYWRSVYASSLSLFQSYKTLFLYFRIYLVVYVLLGLLVLFQNYKKMEFLEDRRKIRWIFWGIAAGIFPFIFLHTLPDVLFGRVLIPEVVNYMFMLLIPVSFAFSILRYRAMDIDVVINRSLVYSLLTVFILGIYLLVAGILGEILHRLTGYEGSLYPILATLMAALLFAPAKNRIRVLVDRTFYRVRYDYRKAVQKFTRQVNLAFTREELFNLILRKIELLLAVNRALIFLREEKAKGFEIAGSSGFYEEELEEIRKDKSSLLSDILKTKKIQGAKGSSAFREIPLLPEINILKKYEIKLSFPFTAKEDLIGLLLVGKKKSEVRYSAEDIELVSLMVQELIQALQNIKMRERIMAEQLEKEKLEELNKLKTKFISNVSHDLRTPLTTIRFSADNMLQGVCGELSDESRNCLQMIKESTIHVSRMIENLLTLSLSESGRIALNQEKLPLAQVVDEACSMVKILAERKGIELVREEFGDTCVYADKHSLLEILLNLLDNALKYTDSGGRVSVSAKRIKEGKLVELSVTDNGAGIPPEKLEKIFERFHKFAAKGKAEEKGLGIGLDIVRNLVHLHSGEIKVESSVSGNNKGTKFSFTLPQV